MKILPSLMLLIPLYATANESPVGLWQFEHYAVYVEIDENGDTFQCRVDVDDSLITASGKYSADNTILWEPVKIVDENGNPMETDNFSWEKDQVIIKNEEMTLNGPYGSFTYQKIQDQMPVKCK